MLTFGDRGDRGVRGELVVDVGDSGEGVQREIPRKENIRVTVFFNRIFSKGYR